MITVNFGGKERGFKFNMLAMEKFDERVPIALDQKTKKLVYPEKSKIIYATFYAGLVGYACAKEEEQDFTYEDVQDWVDKMFLDGRELEIKLVCDAFAETEVWKAKIKAIDGWTDKVRTMFEDKEEGDKKKATSITSGSKLKSSPLVV